MNTVSGFTVEQLLDALSRCGKNNIKLCKDCAYAAACEITGFEVVATDAIELIKDLLEKSPEIS